MTRRELMTGAAAFALPGLAAAQDPSTPEASPPALARLEAARRGLEQFDKAANGGDGKLARKWARRVAAAELALYGRRAERLAALEAYVCRARDAERTARVAYEARAGVLADLLEAEFYRADAEALLAEEKARPASRK